MSLSDQSFTYIIRSSNKENSSDLTRSCNIRLQCPSLYKFYECEVVGFYLGYTGTKNDFYTSGIFELRSEYGLEFSDYGSDTKTKSLSTIAFSVSTTCYSQQVQKFKVANFNGRSVKFSIYDDAGNLLTYQANGTTLTSFDKPWVLVLNMKGTNE